MRSSGIEDKGSGGIGDDELNPQLFCALRIEIPGPHPMRVCSVLLGSAWKTMRLL